MILSMVVLAHVILTSIHTLFPLLVCSVHACLDANIRHFKLIIQIQACFVARSFLQDI